MEIKIKEQEKILEVWLTREEKEQRELGELLTPVFEVYKAKKFIVAIFFSGLGDLTENTAGLIRHNKAISEQKGGE